VLALGAKLGPILWQLPPQLPYDAARLAAFFELLPRTTRAVAKLAKRHDDRLKHRAYTGVDEDRPVRHALEVRHPSFLDNPEFLALLKAHAIGLCVADTAGKWPMIEEVTADFVYVRLHGDKVLYVSGYGPRALDRWAERIRRWADQGEVYVYFDNDVKARAPFDAINLAARLGQCPPTRFPSRALGLWEAQHGVEEPRTRWTATRGS
jgi:uncharacterized protein YecE (DUF72 family)